MKKLFQIFLLLSTFVSCNTISKEYQVEFHDYYKEITHKEKLPKFVFIIPLNTCHTCVNELYKIARKSDNKADIIIILEGENKYSLREVKKELPQINIYSDEKSLLFNLKYKAIESSEPVFLKISGKQVSERIIVDSENRNKHFSKIRSLLGTPFGSTQ